MKASLSPLNRRSIILKIPMRCSAGIYFHIGLQHLLLPTIRSTSGKGTDAKYLSAAICKLSAAALILTLSLLFKAATSAVVLGIFIKSSPVINAS